MFIFLIYNCHQPLKSMIDWNRVRSEGLPSQIYLSARHACDGDFFRSLLLAPQEHRPIAMLVIALEIYRLRPTEAHANLVRSLRQGDPTSVMDI